RTPPLWGCGRKSDRNSGRHSAAALPPAGSPSSTRSWSSTRSSVAAEPPPCRQYHRCRSQLDRVTDQEWVEPEVEHFCRRNEVGEPEQSEKVNRDLSGDHRDDGTRQIFRPAKICKPAHDECRRHEARQVSVSGRTGGCG